MCFHDRTLHQQWLGRVELDGPFGHQGAAFRDGLAGRQFKEPAGTPFRDKEAVSEDAYGAWLEGRDLALNSRPDDEGAAMLAANPTFSSPGLCPSPDLAGVAAVSSNHAGAAAERRVA